jgi:hypothetical protein
MKCQTCSPGGASGRLKFLQEPSAFVPFPSQSVVDCAIAEEPPTPMANTAVTPTSTPSRRRIGSDSPPSGRRVNVVPFDQCCTYLSTWPAICQHIPSKSYKDHPFGGWPACGRRNRWRVTPRRRRTPGGEVVTGRRGLVTGAPAFHRLAPSGAATSDRWEVRGRWTTLEREAELRAGRLPRREAGEGSSSAFAACGACPCSAPATPHSDRYLPGAHVA